MLIWMCALHCEAKPVIDFYRLQKIKNAGDFDLYSNDNHSCIVSGIGHLKMASATAWAAALHQHQSRRCWINLGTGGHKTLKTGSTILASKISSSASPAVFNLSNDIQHDFQLKEVVSFAAEQIQYPAIAVCDMEAFAFIQAANKFCSADQCHSIKVISDNAESPAHKNKARISALIADNMPAISRFAQKVLHKQNSLHA